MGLVFRVHVMALPVQVAEQLYVSSVHLPKPRRDVHTLRRGGGRRGWVAGGVGVAVPVSVSLLWDTSRHGQPVFEYPVLAALNSALAQYAGKLTGGHVRVLSHDAKGPRLLPVRIADATRIADIVGVKEYPTASRNPTTGALIPVGGHDFQEVVNGEMNVGSHDKPRHTGTALELPCVNIHAIPDFFPRWPVMFQPLNHALSPFTLVHACLIHPSPAALDSRLSQCPYKVTDAKPDVGLD